MYIQKHLIDIKLMKKFLAKESKTSFTRKEFVNNTNSSNYYFREMVDGGLIEDTGLVYSSQRGSPIAYKLNNAFVNNSNLHYTLSQEDIDMLIQNKTNRVKTLNDKITVMQAQVNSLQSENDSLLKLKGDA